LTFEAVLPFDFVVRHISYFILLMFAKYYFLWLFLLVANQVAGQQWSNWRQQRAIGDSLGRIILSDTTFILAESLQIWEGDRRLGDSLFWYEAASRTIFLRQKSSTVFDLRYRALPNSVSAYRQHKNRAIIGAKDSLDGTLQLMGGGYAYNPYRTQANTQAIDMQGINYSGTFGRAISVGSNQSLVQDANFNLQLSGKLGDVEVLAAITDNNVPVQPNGNTQQLQDFDRVFIQFKLGNQALIAGDYNLSQSKNSYFARYNRRLQGGRLNNQFKTGANSRLNTSVSFALARGKFARNSIQGQEGNQGPYKMTGNNGERFIIIIAGTEQVFIDGQPLTRGADRDYIIDYNLGEVRFTNRQLITKDKRIIIEFTYNDLNFVRSLYDIQAEWQHKNTALRFTHFSEQDARNQSTQQILNDTTRGILQQVGDSLDLAYTSGITAIERGQTTSGMLLYKLIDSTANGIFYDSILYYAPNDSTAIYTVQFSLVASGGNYIRLQNGTNGAVFQWVAPDPLTGKSLGTHAPVVLLIAPKKQQLTTFGIKIPTDKKGFFDAEVALSNNDINTFSNIGNGDNLGLATRLNYEQSWQKATDSSRNTKQPSIYTLRAYYEYTQARFLPLDPYRQREFQRDWNTLQLPKTAEHWAGLSFSLQNQRVRMLRYETSFLSKDSIYTGFRQDLRADIQPHKNLRLQAAANLLLNDGSSQTARFFRPQVEINYTLPKWRDWQIGARWEQEQNAIKDKTTDTLAANSFYFDIFKLYTILPIGNKNWELRSHVQRRIDHAPDSAQFLQATRADEANIAAKWQSKGTQSLDFNFNYRKLLVSDTDTARTTAEPQNTYVGRGEYNLQIRKGFIRANTIYELGSGQQQKIEYNFIQTDLGAGTHVWIDRNGDGIAQQNEFEQANFQDQANYIRVTILSNEFIRTQNVAFSQSFDLNPKILFARKPQALESRKMLAFFVRFSARSLLRIDRKSFAQSARQPFNPFIINVNDTSLVSLGSQVQNSLFFNRSVPKFNVELSHSDSRNKNLLATGFESRQKTEYTLLYRIKLQTKWLVSHSSSIGTKANQSDFFADRNYRIQFFFTEPQVSFLQGSHFRLIGKYNFRRQINRIGAGENNQAHTFSVEANYSKTQSWNLRAQISLVQLQYEGNSNTPIEFALNEGLRAGSNLLWTCSVDKNIAQNIQFSLTYEGRKTSDSPIVHVGRAQIRANF
jgi:hypothetical protein